METNYTKNDFLLNNHRMYTNEKNETFYYLNFGSSSITHRFGGLVENNKIGIKTNTCNTEFENCNFINRFSMYVKFINQTLGNYKNYYFCDNTIIQFNSIIEANNWLSFMFDFVLNNEYSNLSTYLNSKKLPKGIILNESYKDKSFKFLKVNDDFTISEIDFRKEYNINYLHNENDLYLLDFDKMERVQNLKCKTWV